MQLVVLQSDPERSLRGCIGCFADLELGSGIEEYALTAALKDSRFPPVQMKEVAGLSCTVSLLTNFEDCANAYDWNLQNHGIKMLSEPKLEKVWLKRY